MLDYLLRRLALVLADSPRETLFLWGHAIVDEVAKWAGAFTAKVKQHNEPYELYKLKQPTNPMDSSNFTGHTNKCV